MSKNNSISESLAIVWTTVRTAADAKTLAASMLENRLAACVQIDSPIQSHYRWKGKMEVETEHRLIIKTRSALTQKLVDWLQENHPYDEPQILVTDVAQASLGYGRWVVEQTT